jgi:hypothetical protein
MKANYKMKVAALTVVALGALVMMVSGIATALAQDTVRVRGTIERIDGSTYVVKARDGAELKVALADNPQIAGVVKASLSDIKQGSFVGVTAMPKADGSQAHSKYISFLRPCAEPGKDTTHGIFSPRAQ